MERFEGAAELNGVRYQSFAEIAGKLRELSERYGNIPMGQLAGMFGGRLWTANPYAQNQRVKGIPTRPADYSKDEVARMVQNPEGSEQPLRAVERALEYSAYPLRHLRRVYQDLLTYHSYVAPALCGDAEAKRPEFWREWKLLEKLRRTLNPKESCHMLAGQALQEGKVFYVPRVRVDRAHNQVDHAFLQQLPSDFVKIVGFNNISKYTVAFNLMYFLMPGTDWRQFGDLFEPFIADFQYVMGRGEGEARPPRGVGTKIIYAGREKERGKSALTWGMRAPDLRRAEEVAGPEVEIAFEKIERKGSYYQGGQWCYWVTLPVDRVFPFEIDDADVNVLPAFTGLFLDMLQLAQLEQIQLELLQNPLVSLLHGEIPYWNERTGGKEDAIKLSNAGRMLFESLWYQMLEDNSTGGIGLFAAPFANMKLESLQEAPGAMEIVSTGYKDTMSKAGVTAVIPASDDARAGAVQVSLAIESRMPQTIYRCYERMMRCVIRKLNLKYEWEFQMFGDLATDKEREKTLKEEMTLGILSAAIPFNAMQNRSILDDICWSGAVMESGLMEMRVPLKTSYTQSGKDAGNAGRAAEVEKEAGRPPAEDVSSDGQEQDLDGGVGK